MAASDIRFHETEVTWLALQKCRFGGRTFPDDESNNRRGAQAGDSHGDRAA